MSGTSLANDQTWSRRTGSPRSTFRPSRPPRTRTRPRSNARTARRTFRSRVGVGLEPQDPILAQPTPQEESRPSLFVEGGSPRRRSSVLLRAARATPNPLPSGSDPRESRGPVQVLKFLRGQPPIVLGEFAALAYVRSAWQDCMICQNATGGQEGHKA